MADRPPRSLKYRQRRDRPLPPRSGASRYRDTGVEVFPNLGPHPEVKVSFTVMAHPKRKEWAEELAEQIGCDITWDRVNDRHDTGLRAIKAYAPSADYHVVVQDDVLLPRDFADGVRAALRFVEPGAPASFYYGGKGNAHSKHVAAWQAGEAAGASWLVRKGPIWGPAIAYHTANIPALVDYFEASEVQNYDRRVMKFYQSRGIRCWYSLPCLVEHRQENNPSLCGHDRGLREARRFVGPRSALEVDWSGPVAGSPS